MYQPRLLTLFLFDVKVVHIHLNLSVHYLVINFKRIVDLNISTFLKSAEGVEMRFEPHYRSQKLKMKIHYMKRK
jgi:hypothetical protein